MRTPRSSIEEQAFGEQANAGLVIACTSHQLALRFLESSLGNAYGIALLQGPAGSGKTTIVNEQLAWSARNAAVALIDGKNLTPRHLLKSILSQFGVENVPQHDEHMLQAINKFAAQQTQSTEAPIVIVDDVDRATPSALRILNWLAALDVRGRFALRLILTGKVRLSDLVKDDSYRSLGRRHPPTFSLNPLTVREAMLYLRTRLIAAGSKHADDIFPLEVCERLHEASAGWPGRLNECAAELLQQLPQSKKGESYPRIVITCDGETVATHELTKAQCVIGRADLADIMVEDKFVSKMHAMLKLYSNALVLHDLNSTNGTIVNSREVRKTILRSDDIISLGRHRLKIENAPAISAETDARIRASDTLTMKNLDDIRRVRAQHTIAALKHK